jgi:type II secretory pathway pseudopilin PulG
MLMLAPRTPRPLSTEDGITLVELLVAMVMSVIIVAGLIAVFSVTLRQSARITNQVQANRKGRVTLTKSVEELHSACTGLNTLPIQAPSTTPSSPLAASNAVNLWFLSAYGNKTSAESVIGEVTEHDLNWTATKTSSTGLSMGTLTDYSFVATGGEAPLWTFPTLNTTNAKAKVIGTNVIAPAGKLFTYQKYNTSGQLIEVPVPLTATTAKAVANVKIALTQAPDSGDTRPGRAAELSDSVLLRFSPGETGTEAENTPCN